MQVLPRLHPSRCQNAIKRRHGLDDGRRLRRRQRLPPGPTRTSYVLVRDLQIDKVLFLKNHQRERSLIASRTEGYPCENSSWKMA
jgi:hypothetical protein